MNSMDDGAVPQQDAAVRLSVEYVDRALLGIRDGEALPDAMEFCRAILSSLAINAAAVVLVVTGDFVESVKARLPEGPYRDSYDQSRGAGTVAGKTLVAGDEVHVLLDAWMFLDADSVDAHGVDEDTLAIIRQGAEERARQARRTVIHEAHHVAMEQSGEDTVNLEGLSWRRQNFVNVAHQVISEYRAELGVPIALRDPSDQEFPLESLAALRSDLHRIALVEYQQHRQVDKLAYDITQQSHHLWKVLAYVAAARRAFDVPVGDPVPPDVRNSSDWALMAEPHWIAFEELLHGIPAGSERIDPRQLEGKTDALADMLSDWLRTFGFVWTDTRFDIESIGLFATVPTSEPA